MVKIGVQIKANLENITNLIPDAEEYRWCMKLKCSSCGEVTDKWQYFNDQEEQELKNSRGTAHFILKCKFCGRENYLNVLPGSLEKYTADDANKFKTIVKLDCRGVEPVEMGMSKPWNAEGVESGTKFVGFSLEENEWVDYDEKAQESVGIYETQGQFVKLKN